jgi:hypothetical protein
MYYPHHYLVFIKTMGYDVLHHMCVYMYVYVYGLRLGLLQSIYKRNILSNRRHVLVNSNLAVPLQRGIINRADIRVMNSNSKAAYMSDPILS